MSKRFQRKVSIDNVSNESIASQESRLVALGTGSNVLTQHEGLVCKYVTAATVDIDADAILLKTSDGKVYRAESVNLTVDISTGTGINTLDTGSEAGDTWYYIWVIYNGTTVAGLLSASSTAPTMPSGYTYKGLVGAVRNDASSDFVNFYQRGGVVSMTTQTAISGGTATSFTAVSVAALVPVAITSEVYANCTAAQASAGTINGYVSVAIDSAGTDIHAMAGGYMDSTVQRHYASGWIMLDLTGNFYYKSSISSNSCTIQPCGYRLY